jgi:hypothetical protein
MDRRGSNLEGADRPILGHESVRIVRHQPQDRLQAPDALRRDGPQGPETGDPATLALDPAAGELRLLAHTETERSLHSFCLVPGPRFLVSAAFTTNRLLVYRRDAVTGRLHPQESFPCGRAPVSILAVRRR